jgi:hypothetical protein
VVFKICNNEPKKLYFEQGRKIKIEFNNGTFSGKTVEVESFNYRFDLDGCAVFEVYHEELHTIFTNENLDSSHFLKIQSFHLLLIRIAQ